MPSPTSPLQQPRCDFCGRYGDYCEQHDEYLCIGCENERYGLFVENDVDSKQNRK